MEKKNAHAEPLPPDVHGLLFRDILDGLDDPVLVVDQAFAAIYANPAYSEAFGDGPGPLFWERLPEDEAAGLKARLYDCAQSGAAGFSAGLRLRGAPGEWESFEVRVKAHRPKGGEALYALHLHSIVDLIREKRERADRELRYQALAEQACDAFFVHDFAGRLVEVNRRACDSLGYTREELLRMSVTDIEQDFNLQSAQEQWATIKPGEDFTLYGQHRRKDGTLFPVEIRFGCSIWRGERLFLGMVRDITERRQAEEKFRRMVEGAPDPIFIQTDGKFAYVNPAACRLFGIASPDELLHTPVLERVHPENREQALERMHRLNVERKPIKKLFEQRFLRSDGSVVWVETKGEPIAYEGRHGALVFVRDTTERKIAEQKLRESTERFRVAFECSASGMCLMGTDGTFSSVNQAMCAMFDCPREQLEGKRFGDVTHPDDCHLSMEAVHRMISGKEQSVMMEKRYIRANGDVFWASVSSALVRDGDGRPVHFIAQIQDITERKAMERELKEKEAFNRAVMDNLPIGIAVNTVFPDVSFAYMNDKFPLLYRTTRQALSSPDAFWDAAYEDPVFRDEIKARVLADMASGDPSQRVWESIPVTRKGEETRYVSAYNTPVPGSGLVISTVTDVTQRIRDEQALVKKARRLEALHEIDQAILKGVDLPGTIAGAALMRLYGLLETKRAFVGLLEPDGKTLRVLAANVDGEAAQGPAIVELHGDLELIKNGGMDIVQDANDTALAPRVADALRGEGVLACILVPLISTGRLIGALSLGFGTPRVFEPEELAIAQEVAAQLALVVEQARMRRELADYAAGLEQRVRERTAQYEAANKELEAFSYSVSHDLRAPLRSVDGYVQILLEDYSTHLDDNGKRVCGVISNSARQMGRLIDDLLAFSRVGRADMKLVAVDMGELATSIFHELTTAEERAGIELTIGPMPLAPADPTLMRQVWMNLLSNAIKFSSKKEKTVIEISGERQGDENVYTVADRGAGFDQQYVDKLFGVFQRLHSAREFEGTGVGLAIVQRIIARHGGRVWALGKTGEGASFYFSLKRGDDHGTL